MSRLVNRPVVSTNISPPAFFLVIAETRPTLLIDEADRLLKRHPIWIGGVQARGYLFDDFREAFKRYIPETVMDALKARLAAEKTAATLSVPPRTTTR